MIRKAAIFYTIGSILDLIGTYIVLTYLAGIEGNPIFRALFPIGGWPLVTLVKFIPVPLIVWLGRRLNQKGKKILYWGTLIYLILMVLYFLLNVALYAALLYTIHNWRVS